MRYGKQDVVPFNSLEERLNQIERKLDRIVELLKTKD